MTDKNNCHNLILCWDYCEILRGESWRIWKSQLRLLFRKSYKKHNYHDQVGRRWLKYLYSQKNLGIFMGYCEIKSLYFRTWDLMRALGPGPIPPPNDHGEIKFWKSLPASLPSIFVIATSLIQSCRAIKLGRLVLFLTFLLSVSNKAIQKKRNTLKILFRPSYFTEVETCSYALRLKCFL